MERLADVASKNLELHMKVEEKRVALLALKEQQLLEIGRPSDDIREALDAARARMAAYADRLAEKRRLAAPTAPAGPGFVQLSRLSIGKNRSDALDNALKPETSPERSEEARP